ncbi:hypothetical protein, partial [Erwinia amylovora]|uniref:hypothetical protein n=1 Tax=Erwinia amylovora TaxID=552 RepID=UPI0020C17878
SKVHFFTVRVLFCVLKLLLCVSGHCVCFFVGGGWCLPRWFFGVFFITEGGLFGSGQGEEGFRGVWLLGLIRIWNFFFGGFQLG